MRRADELLPEAPKPKRGRPPKAKAQALANYDAGDVERPAGERWVTMSNALTRAGHGLTLAEKRIVAAAVSRRCRPVKCREPSSRRWSTPKPSAWT